MKLSKDSQTFLIGFFHLALLHFSIGEDALQPEIIAEETDVTVNKGLTAKLKCTVKNQGTKTVIWRRVDETNPLTIGTFPYVTGGRITALHNKYSNTWTLQIRKLKLSDMGVYECQVSSKSHIVKHFKLTVTDEDIEEEKIPPVVLTGRKYVEIGEPIQLICNATGEEEPPMDLDWFKDGDKINSNSNTKIEISKYKKHRSIISQLSVDRARPKDKGDYVCRTGFKDEETASIEVHVLNAATNNVKRGTEKDEKINAEKKNSEKTDARDTKSAKAKEVTYETMSGNSGALLKANSVMIYLFTWTIVLLRLLQNNLPGVVNLLTDPM